MTIPTIEIMTVDIKNSYKRAFSIKKTPIILILFFIFSFINLYAQEKIFKTAEDLFINNKPNEAIPLFISALQQEPNNEKIYLFLGISYAQTKNYNKSVETFLEGARKAPKDRDVFYYNAGNIYYILGQYVPADEMYSRALKENANNKHVYLNRANTRLNMQMYEEALADYKVFLAFDHQNYQRESILKLINILESKLTFEKELKIEEEQRKLAEERRRQELLNEVLGSLKNVGSETRNVSAGTEKIGDYAEELDLKE